MKTNKILMRQLNGLAKLDIREIRQKFVELFGFTPGNTTGVTLRKRLAYRLQEIHFGGLSKEDMAKLNAIADGDPLANLCTEGVTPKMKIKGTRLTRNWKGEIYEVTTLGDGTFEYNGKVWKSLSAIARSITGTRWNGKLFFGVK